MSRGLSKSRILAWRQCPKRLWLQVHRSELLITSAETERNFQIGFEVGEVARRLYPDGILIEQQDLSLALAKTREVIANHPDKPIFEATFERDRVLVQADLLLPEGVGHRMVEVKSSTGVKETYVEDCAIQSWVVGGSQPLAGVELAHIDNRFVYPGNADYAGLFQRKPLDDQIAPLIGQVPDWVAGARDTLGGGEPGIAPGDQCESPYACAFQEYCGCHQDQAEFPLSWLPHLSAKKRKVLEGQGIRDMRDIPDSVRLSAQQQRVRAATLSGRMELSPQAAQALARLAYPRYYLDFESMSVAVPFWVGTRPYQAIPVQWSCHTETGQGGLDHQAFLAEGEGDPRSAFAESLVAALGAAGPVFVYNRGFEGRILRKLAASLPALAPALNAIIDRLVDLLPLTRDHYYHPAMHGSWSIKSVLPTIAPDLSYSEMEIGDGGRAESAWREIYHPAIAADKKATLRQALAKYCALDTFAMVRLATFLSEGE